MLYFVYVVPPLVKKMLIPNPFNEKLKFFNEILHLLFKSVYEFLHPSEFKSYVISQRQIRWQLCQEVDKISKVYDDLIVNKESKNGHALNVKKYQVYPSKPTVHDVKSAENTKDHLWNFTQKIESNIKELKERCSNLYNKSKEIPAYRSNELAFYEKEIKILSDIKNETDKALNNVIHCHKMLKKRYYPTVVNTAEESRKKRRLKENKRKCKKRKQQLLEKNANELISILCKKDEEDFTFKLGTPFIKKEHLSSLNAKYLQPKRHLGALQYLLENNCFHEDAIESIQSIISVLEVQKITKKKRNTGKKTSSKVSCGQKTLHDLFGKVSTAINLEREEEEGENEEGGEEEEELDEEGELDEERKLDEQGENEGDDEKEYSSDGGDSLDCPESEL